MLSHTKKKEIYNLRISFWYILLIVCFYDSTLHKLQVTESFSMNLFLKDGTFYSRYAHFHKNVSNFPIDFLI
jgi:hypothetical protein